MRLIEQFVEAVDKATKGQAIVFDETMGYLSSRGSMSKFNRKLIKIFSEMRSKNLFIFLCIPSFFELDRYPAIHRSLTLIHVHKRGTFTCFNYGKKKLLYIYGKKFYSYSKPNADFIGSYSKYFPLDKVEYEKKKQSGIRTFWEDKEKVVAMKEQRNRMIVYLFKEKGWTCQEIAKMSGLSLNRIWEILKEERHEVDDRTEI